MIEAGQFSKAVAAAFPQGVALPKSATELRELIGHARLTTPSVALTVLDRMVSGGDSALIERLVAGMQSAASESGRQQAADLSGRGDPRALLRLVDVPDRLRALESVNLPPTLRNIVIAQLSSGPGPAPLYKSSLVLHGDASITRPAAEQYARALYGLGVVSSGRLINVPVVDRTGALHFGDAAANAAALARRAQDVFSEARAESAVVFIDVASVTARDRNVPVGKELLSALARELVVQLSHDCEARVVLSGSREDLRLLFECDEGLPRRIRFIEHV